MTLIGWLFHSVCAASIYRIVTILYIKDSDPTCTFFSTSRVDLLSRSLLGYHIYIQLTRTPCRHNLSINHMDICGTLRWLSLRMSSHHPWSLPTLLIKWAIKPRRRSKNTSLTLGGSAVSGSTTHTTNVEYIKLNAPQPFNHADHTHNKISVGDPGTEARNQIRVNTTFEVV